MLTFCDRYIYMFCSGLTIFLKEKLHQHAQQTECCKNSRIKTTVRVTKRIQQKTFDFIITSMMKKRKLEPFQDFQSSKNYLRMSIHLQKALSATHLQDAHKYCIAGLLPASVIISAPLKSSSPVLSLLSTNILYIQNLTVQGLGFKV